MKKILVTNNGLVNEKFNNYMGIIYLENYTFIEVLKYTRDKIHKGHRLLTHPLAGSVKPNETPFKSIVISPERGEIDFQSLSIIEESINTAEKFINGKNTPKWSKEILDDFKLIDYYLVKSGIESMDQF